MAGFGLGRPADCRPDGSDAPAGAGRASRVIVLTDGPRDMRALDELDALRASWPSGAAPDLLLGGWPRRRRQRPDGAAAAPGWRAAGGRLAGGDARALRWSRIAGGEVGVDAVATAAARTDRRDREAAGDHRRRLLRARAAQPLAPAPVRGSAHARRFRKLPARGDAAPGRRRDRARQPAFVKRAPFPITGTLTRGDLERALPYRAVIGAARVPGPVVDSLLGPALGNAKLAVVGLGQGAGGLQVNGRPLDKSARVPRGHHRLRRRAAATASSRRARCRSRRCPAPRPARRGGGLPRHDTAVEDQRCDRRRRRPTSAGPPPTARCWWLLGRRRVRFLPTPRSPTAAYGDAQLTRAQQTSIKGEATLVAQIRHPVHDADGRFDAQYGWARNKPPGMPAVSGESVDLITAIVTYSYRGLRDWRRVPKPSIPDPVRARLAGVRVHPSRRDAHPDPHLPPPAAHQYRRRAVHADAAAQGCGPAPARRASCWRPHAEAAAGTPSRGGRHARSRRPSPPGRRAGDQARGALRLRLRRSRPTPGSTSCAPPASCRFRCCRRCSSTVGLDVFAVQRQQAGWAASYDTTIGLRLHTDFAHQPL